MLNPEPDCGRPNRKRKVIMVEEEKEDWITTSPKWRKGNLWIKVRLPLSQHFNDDDVQLLIDEGYKNPVVVDSKTNPKVVVVLSFLTEAKNQFTTESLSSFISIQGCIVKKEGRKDTQILHIRFKCSSTKSNFVKNADPNRITAREISTYLHVRVYNPVNTVYYDGQIEIPWSKMDYNKKIEPSSVGTTLPPSPPDSPVYNPKLNGPNINDLNMDSPYCYNKDKFHIINELTQELKCPNIPNSTRNLLLSIISTFSGESGEFPGSALESNQLYKVDPEKSHIGESKEVTLSGRFRPPINILWTHSQEKYQIPLPICNIKSCEPEYGEVYTKLTVLYPVQNKPGHYYISFADYGNGILDWYLLDRSAVNNGGRQEIIVNYDNQAPTTTTNVFNFLGTNFIPNNELDIFEDIKFEDDWLLNYMHYAVAFNKMNIVSHLIHKGHNAYARDIYGKTPFFYAVRNGNIQMVKYLLGELPGINTYSAYDGTTTLHIASLHGNLQMMELLLTHPSTTPRGISEDEIKKIKKKTEALVNVCNRYNESALYYAVWSGNLKAVQFLVERGSSILRRTNEGVDAITLAKKFNYEEIVKYLSQKREEKQQESRLKNTPRKISDKEATRAEEAIDDFIEHSSKYLQESSRLQFQLEGKVRVPSPGEGTDSLFSAFETILRAYFPNRFPSDKSFYAQEYEDYLKILDPFTSSTGSFGEPQVLDPLQIFIEMFRLNLVVLSYDPLSTHQISKQKYYVPNHKRKDNGMAFLAFNGRRYDAIINNTSEIKHSSSTLEEILVEAVDNPISENDFKELLDEYAKRNKLNDMITISRQDQTLTCTLLYYACLKGRTELACTLLQQEGIIIDGPQESQFGNSPLHVASWMGNFPIVLMLLYEHSEVKPNKNGDLPSKINPALDKIIKDKLAFVWQACTNHDYQNFKKIIESFPILDGPEATQPTEQVQEKKLQQDIGDTVTIDDLCKHLDCADPPDIEKFKKIIEKFDKKLINTYSSSIKCTPLYCAAKWGHIEHIKIMTEYFKDLKLNGPQETYTGHGNTPLHVANWRGHVPVVAYLLYKGVRLEKKPGGSKKMPGHFSERNPILNEETKKSLINVLNNYNNKDILKEHMDSAKSETILSPLSYLPTPLVTYLALPKEDLPLEYLRMPYQWYISKGKGLQLLPINESIALNKAYRNYRLNKEQRHRIDMDVPVPPRSSGAPWTYDTWLVNFQEMSAEIIKETNRKTVSLAARTRSKCYYWQAKKTGIWTPFPNKANHIINSAHYSHYDMVEFVMTLDKSLMLKQNVKCRVNFVENIVTMTGKYQNGRFPILDEDKYFNSCFPAENIENDSSYWREQQLKATQTGQGDARFLQIRQGDPDKEIRSQWDRISQYFHMTVPNNKNEIVEIVRVFNEKLRGNFTAEYDRVNQDLKSDQKSVKVLWFGSKGILPSKIVHNGWVGVNNSREARKQRWGKGLYFAADAAYAAANAFEENNQTKTMILAEVVVGESFQCEPNRDITEPPKGFHSIASHQYGSWVYSVYNVNTAYPSYLVKWVKKSQK